LGFTDIFLLKGFEIPGKLNSKGIVVVVVLLTLPNGVTKISLSSLLVMVV
jgi:hypothetical protein